jgi:DNA-binding transcriptional ArsR family regulator
MHLSKPFPESLGVIVRHMPNQCASLDRMFHALADPTRRAVVERLSRGPVSVSELARPFAISLPSVVQHLQVLEECGVIRSEKVGRVRTCHIEPRALRAAEQWIAEQRAVWEGRLDRLDGYLRDLQAKETKDDDRD